MFHNNWAYHFKSSLIYHIINHNHKNIIQVSTGKNNLNQIKISTNINMAQSQIQNFKNISCILFSLKFINLDIHVHNANVQVINQAQRTNKIRIFTMNINNPFDWNDLFTQIWTKLKTSNQTTSQIIKIFKENFLLNNRYSNGIPADIIAPITNHQLLQLENMSL